MDVSCMFASRIYLDCCTTRVASLSAGLLTLRCTCRHHLAVSVLACTLVEVQHERGLQVLIEHAFY